MNFHSHIFIYFQTGRSLISLRATNAGQEKLTKKKQKKSYPLQNLNLHEGTNFLSVFISKDRKIENEKRSKQYE